MLTCPSLLKDVFPQEAIQPLQHLRRIVKPEYLPAHLQTSPPDPLKIRKSHLLAGPTSLISHKELQKILDDNKELFGGVLPLLRVISVPKFAPTTSIQATEWSEKHWPTIYKNQNPYGPHPAIVRRAELEILEEHEDMSVEHYMDLAKQAGSECKERGFGNGAGAVIVDRTGTVDGTGTGKVPRIVSVAGDARYRGWLDCEIDAVTDCQLGSCEGPSCGNAMAHAVVRAIGLVARKRREIAGTLTPPSEGKPKPNPAGDTTQLNPFVDRPMTPLEEHHLAQPSLQPNGYLCLELEVYATHEPCVMCSMAMLHSRFARIVFEKPMPKSGALSSEILTPDLACPASKDNKTSSTLGYGLFWRPELNWRCLCWQWEAGKLCSLQTEAKELLEDDVQA
jgi:tRNA-specific adenosine deaminase 3